MRLPFFLLFAITAVANPLHLNSRQTDTCSPCAAVSASVATQPSGPSATPTVAAQLAYDCLSSVPLNTSAALALVESIRPYLRWQSSTVYIKDPPEEYAEKVQEAVDVWGGLDGIVESLEKGEWESEFQFGWALYRLLQSTHDAHFSYVPDVIGEIFNWARPIPLVSISEDGKELPQPYVYPDILAASLGNVSFTPSHIVTINGEKATDYLENWAQYGSLQDRDALYNDLFYDLAVLSLGSMATGMGTFTGGGPGRWVYPGPTTELEFANGTKTTYTTFAKVLVSFNGITDGSNLYKTYFTHPKDTPPSFPTSISTPTPIPTSSECPTNTTTPTPQPTPTATPTPAPGYPPPVVHENDNLIGGYYLDSPSYSDIAVLAVPSFSAPEAGVTFQETGTKFLSLARIAGKKKLIIDLSGNGGGYILQGYDLFKQLFPGIEPYGGNRFRAFESTYLIGERFSEIGAQIPRTLDTENMSLEYSIERSIFNAETDVNITGQNFPNWETKYGPETLHNDNFSSIIRFNLSDELLPLYSGGIWVHGYRNLTNITQPFKAEDIVVVTDGMCASTCAIFSEMMRTQAGVKYISLGGRSRSGITQAVGGAKGTWFFSWKFIQYHAQLVFNLSSPAEALEYNKTELAQYWSDIPFYRSAKGTMPAVNFRDGFRKGEEEDVPLHFKYEPADCRIFYTREMTVDVTAIWKKVADVMWGGDEEGCVAGDLGGRERTRRSSRSERGTKAEMMEARNLEKRMEAWRRGLRPEDYPMDVYTDLRGVRVTGDTVMLP